MTAGLLLLAPSSNNAQCLVAVEAATGSPRVSFKLQEILGLPVAVLDIPEQMLTHDTVEELL